MRFILFSLLLCSFPSFGFSHLDMGKVNVIKSELPDLKKLKGMYAFREKGNEGPLYFIFLANPAKFKRLVKNSSKVPMKCEPVQMGQGKGKKMFKQGMVIFFPDGVPSQKTLKSEFNPMSSPNPIAFGATGTRLVQIADINFSRIPKKTKDKLDVTFHLTLSKMDPSGFMQGSGSFFKEAKKVTLRATGSLSSPPPEQKKKGCPKGTMPVFEGM